MVDEPVVVASGRPRSFRSWGFEAVEEHPALATALGRRPAELVPVSIGAASVTIGAVTVPAQEATWPEEIDSDPLEVAVIDRDAVARILDVVAPAVSFSEGGGGGGGGGGAGCNRGPV